MMTPRRTILDRSRRARAFTLVEVILAISIAIGILVVALYFYSQATNLRAHLLEESDRISSIRLVMDRLTSELRNAFAQPQTGFHGDATSLQFVTTEPPPRASVIGSRLRAGALVASGIVEDENALVVAGFSTSGCSVRVSPVATSLVPSRALLRP